MLYLTQYMNKIKGHLISRGICLVLITAFITFDITWAYPPEHNSAQSSTLAIQSAFQQQMMTPAGQDFQKSLSCDVGLLISLYVIGKFLLGDLKEEVRPIPIKHLTPILTKELGGALEDIKISEVKIKNGVVVVPYSTREAKKYDIQIRLKNTISPDELSKERWVVYGDYAIKAFPKVSEKPKLFERSKKLPSGMHYLFHPEDIEIIHIPGVVDNPKAIISLREDIEDSYRKNIGALKYLPEEIKLIEVILPRSGQKATIGFMKDRPPFLEGENIVMHILEFGGVDYCLGIRGRPYADGHMAFSTSAIKQKDLGRDQLLLGAIMSKIYGSDYELFYNGVTPSIEDLHIQCIKKKTKLWGVDISRWPVFAVKLENEDLEALAKEAYDKYVEYNKLGANVDVMFNFEGEKAKIILIPRKSDNIRPKNMLGDEDGFSPFGVLEMAGFLFNARSEKDFEMIEASPGLYEKALEGLSWPRPEEIKTTAPQGQAPAVLEPAPKAAVQTEPQLAEIVREYMNNETAKTVAVANALVDSIMETADLYLKDIAKKEKLSEKKTSAEIRERVEKIIRAVSELEKEKLTPDTQAAIMLLKKGLGQIEADGIVSSIITLARRANRVKDASQKLIIGLETDWMWRSGHEEKGSMQHSAVNPLITEIESLEDSLRSMGIDNVIIIHKPRKDLADALLTKAAETNTSMANVIVLASEETMLTDALDRLRHAEANGKPFFAGIDTKYIKKWYEDNKNSTEQLDIRLMEMLSIALELAAGKDRPSQPLIFSYDKDRRILVFLPKPKVVDSEAFAGRCLAEKKALEAA